MRCSTLALLAAIAMTLSACGDSRPPSPAPGPGGPQTIRGDERLGWDQQAPTVAELATFRYAIYVDGNRTEMADVTCASTVSATGFPCSGRLPSMTTGQHTLELASFLVEGQSVTESARSAALLVTVSPALTTQASGTAVRRGDPAPAAPRADVRVVAASEGFDDIADLALAARRLFVAERRGAIHIIEDGVLNPRPSLLAADRVVSLALDPAFERTRLVFVLQASEVRGDAIALRLVRYREVGGTFGERAVVLDNIPTGRDNPRGTVRFGPDGKVYVATTREEDGITGGAQRGQVLRLERDGTTPADEPGFDPVRAAGPAAMDAFDWQPRTSAVWVAERAGALERLALVPVERDRARQGVRDAEAPLASGTQVAALHFYRGDRIRTLHGGLLVASNLGLLAVRFDRRQPLRVASIETLLEGQVRAVTSDAHGRLFVATATAVMQVDLAAR